jgi:hypothetical protein
MMGARDHQPDIGIDVGMQVRFESTSCQWYHVDGSVGAAHA